MLAKILDRAAQALHRNVPAATDFLSPQQQIQALDLLRLAEAPSSSYVLTGGYEGAERQLFLFLPDWLEPEDALTDSPIRVCGRRSGLRTRRDIGIFGQFDGNRHCTGENRGYFSRA